jgi:hypothetical protein
MKQRRFNSPPQPTPKDLTDACLAFIRRKFYGASPEESKAFAQDRQKLLGWVVLWPASWLNQRGVTIHGDQYREIFMKVFLQAAAHMDSKVKYRPAYLRQVIQSHWKIHGEDYYDQAKSVRNLADHALLVAGQARKYAPDPVKEMASANQILASLKPKKLAVKTPVKTQLSLFGAT